MSNKNDLFEAAIKKIEPITRILESRFDIKISSRNVEHLQEVMEHYSDKRNIMLKTLGESQALANPNYAKAVLISEGVRKVLREIAPHRRNKKKK